MSRDTEADGHRTEVTEEELRAFVGPRADFYVQRWLHPDEGPDRNWAAFLVGGLWLGYRKLYRVHFCFYSLLIAEALLEEIVLLEVLGRQETPLWTSVVVGFLAAAVCGSFGNSWYRTKAVRVIREVRALRLEQAEAEAILAKRGGTSILISFLLLIPILLLAALLADLMLLLSNPATLS